MYIRRNRGREEKKRVKLTLCTRGFQLEFEDEVQAEGEMMRRRKKESERATATGREGKAKQFWMTQDRVNGEKKREE